MFRNSSLILAFILDSPVTNKGKSFDNLLFKDILADDIHLKLALKKIKY